MDRELLAARAHGGGFTWYQAEGRRSSDDIRDALVRQTDEHCAYCDHFPLGLEATAEIDHFQPKSDDRFAHLAYEWTNLYGVCRRCNLSKSDRWMPALLRPDDENYAFDRYFEVDLLTGMLEPRSDATEADRERARVTIEVFGLNLHPRPRERARIAREPIEDGPYRYLFA